MGNTSELDICESVIISKTEYRELVCANSKLRIAKDYLEKHGYVDSDTLRIILGVDKKESEEV